ncbi:MAG: NAD(P)-binding domain-containing protein [Betaproteobacteria bacterium]|nr:NAD(P)-binding domain-containing protein [Betaproteobacteria bacterium]MBV9362245.1 NAD(P)-binding domain-containing protein [Betaproteobacteria bacterium]
MKRRAFLFAMTAAAVMPALAQGKPTKIGIIGSGRIGSTFGTLWAKAGHEIMFSDRDADVAKKAAEAVGTKALSGSVEQAVAFGDVVFIAVPYGALPAIAQQVGSQLKGKVVIDPNNPVPARDGELGAQAKEKGAAISTAAILPGAKLVRAFNSWGYQTMAREANRPAPRMAIPIAADDPGALKVGIQLVSDAGFDPVPAGSLAASKAFDLGSSVSGKVMTADEMRKALSLN